MVDWAKVGRYAGYAFLFSVILVSVAAIIGVALLQSTPCYKGALKSTGSHMLAMRMASACHNDGYPLPLSNPPLLDLTDVTVQNKSGKSGTRKKPTTVTGWITGVALSAAMSLIVFGVVSYLIATRGKKGLEASTQSRDAGRSWDLLDSIQKRSGIEVPEADMADIAEGLLDTHRAGDVAEGEAIQNGLVKTNKTSSENGLPDGHEVATGGTTVNPQLEEVLRNNRDSADLAQQQIQNSGQANKESATNANEELNRVGDSVSVVDAGIQSTIASVRSAAHVAKDADDLAKGVTARQKAEAAEAEDFEPENKFGWEDEYRGYFP